MPVLIVLSALAAPVACGGSTPAADEPESSAGTLATSRDEDGPGPSEDGEEGEAAAPARACNDETCFACGAGLCLDGMYCDLGAGPGCSWLPECAQSPSCACITRVLGSDCRCDDSGGGPEVDCGSG